jgi:hypothetical protein
MIIIEKVRFIYDYHRKHAVLLA